jgi:hypothetical protein
VLGATVYEIIFKQCKIKEKETRKFLYLLLRVEVWYYNLKKQPDPLRNCQDCLELRGNCVVYMEHIARIVIQLTKSVNLRRVSGTGKAWLPNNKKSRR